MSVVLIVESGVFSDQGPHTSLVGWSGVGERVDPHHAHPTPPFAVRAALCYRAPRMAGEQIIREIAAPSTD
jgi:hypothetical protein